MTEPLEKESPPPAKQGGISDSGTESYGDLCILSMVKSATATETGSACAGELIKSIKAGRWKDLIEPIRETYWRVMDESGGDRQKAKESIAASKKLLPGILWSGKFSRRTKANLVNHSGLLCADMDELGDRLHDIRATLRTSPHPWALFVSPSGDGLKALFRVRPDGGSHLASYRAVERYVRDLCGVEIDESCKDVSRMCFVSYDPDLYLNEGAIELLPMAEPSRAAPPSKDGATAHPAAEKLEARRRIAAELLGEIWVIDGRLFCHCPNERSHANQNGKKDCELYLATVPTIKCQHHSCAGIVDAVNRELRSRVAKVERQTGNGNAGAHDGSEEGDGDKKVRKSAATELVEMASEYRLFHDAQNRAFARITINDHTEICPVASQSFRKLMGHLYYKSQRKTIRRDSLGEAIAQLEGKALFDAPEESVFLRVAPHGDNILIDLADPHWRVIEVSPDGWRILQKSPVAFIRTGAMKTLPMPEPGGSIVPLWSILNVSEDQRPLVAGALLNYFHPEGPYFVTNFVGEQGTAKTCAARMIRQLVDPSETPLRSPPKEERDLLAQAASNRVVALDNLSRLPDWMSDALCRLSTGGGHSARSLYTDLDEVSLSVKRPVLLNGIEDVCARPDLAERALQIELEMIPEARRMPERMLWERFAASQATIFSGLLDALCRALRELPSLSMAKLPRMADATQWVTAGETSFGWERGRFYASYGRNLAEGAMASLEAHPVGMAIMALLEPEPEWTGTPGELLDALKGAARDDQKNDPKWPKNARALGHALRRLAQALRRAGIKYERGRDANRRILTLCKGGETSSQTSS